MLCLSLTVILCETQVSLRSSGPRVASTNRSGAQARIDQLNTSCEHGMKGGGGAVIEVADDRDTDSEPTEQF